MGGGWSLPQHISKDRLAWRANRANRMFCSFDAYAGIESGPPFTSLSMSEPAMQGDADQGTAVAVPSIKRNAQADRALDLPVSPPLAAK